MSAASDAGAKAAPGDDAGGDGQHVLGGAADLDAAHVGGMIRPEHRRADRLCQCRRRAWRRRPPASPRLAVPRATSAAKLGPDKIAGTAPGAHSPITSLMNFLLPRSMPLAQTITGVPAAMSGASVAATAAHRLRGHHQEERRPRARPRLTIARDGDAVIEPHAGQVATFALLSSAVSALAGILLPQRDLAARRAPQVSAKAVPQAPPPMTAM